jgi:hypothetical protein
LDCQDPELHIFEKIATIQLRIMQLVLIATILLLSRSIMGSEPDRKPEGVAVGLAFLVILLLFFRLLRAIAGYPPRRRNWVFLTGSRESNGSDDRQ